MSLKVQNKLLTKVDSLKRSKFYNEENANFSKNDLNIYT